MSVSHWWTFLGGAGAARAPPAATSGRASHRAADRAGRPSPLAAVADRIAGR